MPLDTTDCLQIKCMIQSAIDDNEWSKKLFQNNLEDRKYYFILGLIVGVFSGIILTTILVVYL